MDDFFDFINRAFVNIQYFAAPDRYKVQSSLTAKMEVITDFINS